MSATQRVAQPTAFGRRGLGIVWSDVAAGLTLLVAVTLTALPLGALIFASLWSVSPGAKGGALTLANWAELADARHAIAVFNTLQIALYVTVMALHFVPFAYLLVVSALRAIDSSLEAASRVARAGIGTTLRRITLPVVTPAILSACLLIFVLASEQFSVPTLIGVQAKIPTLQYEIYAAMVDAPSRPNYAAAAGSLLMAFAAVGLLLYNRATRLSRRFVTVSGKATAPKLVALGPWRYAALGLCTLYLVLAVVAPYAALLLGSFMKFVTPNITPSLFTFNNYLELFARSDTALGLRNTLTFSLTAATAAVLFSSYLSYLTVRGTSRWSRAVELVAMLPLAVPAISFALGLLWAYLLIPVGIYGTVWILILAYVTRFTPQAIRSVSSSLVQIDPELEQSARVHGAAPTRALWTITTPLLRPAMLAAWTLLFVQMTLEVSMTIMLYTSGTVTAALNMWFANFGGFAVLAYSLAVILATMSFVVIVLGQWLFGALRRVP